jgi:hypothetical protein
VVEADLPLLDLSTSLLWPTPDTALLRLHLVVHHHPPPPGWDAQESNMRPAWMRVGGLRCATVDWSSARVERRRWEGVAAADWSGAGMGWRPELSGSV